MDRYLDYDEFMIAILAAFAISAHVPTTFDSLEQAKRDAVAGMSSFQYTTDLSNVGLEPNDGLTVRTEMRSVRYDSYDSNKKPNGHGMTDGGVNWILTSQNRIACSIGGSFTDVPLGLRTLLLPQQVVIDFSAGRQVAFDANPGFTLDGITSVEEEGVKLRKAVATAKLARGAATLTQWFLADKWIVKRFTLEVKGSSPTFSCSGKVSSLSL